MAETGLYEAMSTLRAVRKLRPDPIPDARTAPRARSSDLRADRRQSPALADNRGEGRRAQAALGGAVCRAMGELREVLPQDDRGDRGRIDTPAGRTHDRRRRLISPSILAPRR